MFLLFQTTYFQVHRFIHFQKILFQHTVWFPLFFITTYFSIMYQIPGLNGKAKFEPHESCSSVYSRKIDIEICGAQAHFYRIAMTLFCLCRSIKFCQTESYVLKWPIITIPRFAACKQIISGSISGALSEVLQFSILLFLFVSLLKILNIIANDNVNSSLFMEVCWVCFVLEYLFQLGHAILNRVFTERLAFPRFIQGTQYISYRQMALGKEYHYMPDYMEYLAYQDLEHISIHHKRERQHIYQYYWPELTKGFKKKLGAVQDDIRSLMFTEKKLYKRRPRNFFEPEYWLPQPHKVHRKLFNKN
eukprot:UN23760